MAELNNSNTHNNTPSVVVVTTETRRMTDRKTTKGRTGWPQHVWALELQQ